MSGDSMDRLLDKLSKIPGYPFNRSKDLDFLFELLDEFRNVNLEEELIRFRLWLSECPPHPNLRYRLFLRRWMQNASARRTIWEQKLTNEGETNANKNNGKEENKMQKNEFTRKNRNELS